MNVQRLLIFTLLACPFQLFCIKQAPKKMTRRRVRRHNNGCKGYNFQLVSTHVPDLLRGNQKQHKKTKPTHCTNRHGNTFGEKNSNGNKRKRRLKLAAAARAHN